MIVGDKFCVEYRYPDEAFWREYTSFPTSQRAFAFIERDRRVLRPRELRVVRVTRRLVSQENGV